MSEIKSRDVSETKKPEVENYKNIQPEKGTTVSEAMNYWDKLFGKETNEVDNAEWGGKDNDSESDYNKKGLNDKIGDIEKIDLQKVARHYINDLKEQSEFPDTIKIDSLDISKLEKISAEKNSIMREEFDDNKSKLRKEWEKLNGKEWPRYTEDIKNENGITIRKAGDCYDAHHIQPLELGGKNEASNITPLNLKKHQSIHSVNGSCTLLVEKVKTI